MVYFSEISKFNSMGFGFFDSSGLATAGHLINTLIKFVYPTEDNLDPL